MKKANQGGAPRAVFQICNCFVFLLFTLLCMYPFWYMLMYTLSDSAEALRSPPYLLPSGFSLDNFAKMLEIEGLLPALLISVLRTTLGTALTVFSCAFLGYLFSKPEMPGRKLLYRFLLATMYINGGLIPTFLVFRSYGLLNNFWVYILPTVISAYYVILIKTYVEQLPSGLLEAAAIDGAGYFTVFWRIVFPVSVPILATIAVFSAVAHWNSWFDNYVYAKSNEGITTLQYLLYQYLQQAQLIADRIKNSTVLLPGMESSLEMTPQAIRMTITLLSCLPVFVVYPFAQKYFTKGIMLGAVKG